MSDHIRKYRPDAGEPTLWRHGPFGRRVPFDPAVIAEYKQQQPKRNEHTGGA
jgi:hypothetical protein